MKRDLRSRAKAKHGAGNNAGNSAGKNSAEPTPEQIKSFEQVADRYKGKDQNDLMKELMNAVSDQKSKGTFSADTLDSFYKNAAPMLNDEQRKRMKDLITQIKKE